MATELTSLGVNWYYGPVVDINSNPSNPVIGERAFSSDTLEVIRQARIALTALKAHGFLPCIKHFPGHGDTEKDSHFSLPVINHPKKLLDERELLPYKALKDEAPCIMTAHIIFKALDPTRSGTLSPLINIDLLRKEIGFKGIIVTDDLGMDAVRDEILGKDGARLLLESGCDIFCATLNIPISAIARISFEMEALIRKEAKYREMHEASLERISKALGALRIPKIEPLSDAAFQKNRALADILELDIAKRRASTLSSSFGD
jgi:beta-N-acetylhexosaminidase